MQEDEPGEKEDQSDIADYKAAEQHQNSLKRSPVVKLLQLPRIVQSPDLPTELTPPCTTTIPSFMGPNKKIIIGNKEGQ